jgi:phage tail tape-measure protein
MILLSRYAEWRHAGALLRAVRRWLRRQGAPGTADRVRGRIDARVATGRPRIGQSTGTSAALAAVVVDGWPVESRRHLHLQRSHP